MTDSDRSAGVSYGTQLLLTFEGRQVRETTLHLSRLPADSAYCWVLTALDVPRKSTSLQLAFRYLSIKRINLPFVDLPRETKADDRNLAHIIAVLYFLLLRLHRGRRIRRRKSSPGSFEAPHCEHTHAKGERTWRKTCAHRGVQLPHFEQRITAPGFSLTGPTDGTSRLWYGRKSRNVAIPASLTNRSGYKSPVSAACADPRALPDLGRPGKELVQTLRGCNAPTEP